ncbi:MAG TPA: hypothetical protein VLX44_08895 [Xanthobacteraceae bacterium]|nr:hypothetical protein [Xanthobacteraceae bacterium]
MSERNAWLSRYGLAVACVLAPLVLSMASDGIIDRLINRPIKGSIFLYKIGGDPPASQPSKPAPPQTAPQSAESKLKGPASRAQLVGRYLAGNLNYAASTGFRYLVAAAGIFVGATVVGRTLGTSWLALFFAISISFASWFGWEVFEKARGALLLAVPILTSADSTLGKDFPRATSDTGAFIAGFEGMNYAIGMLGVMMVFFAFAAASIRDPKPTKTDLDRRRVTIWIALLLTSASLVVAVLASRTLLDWSLSLVADPEALKPFSDAIVTQWAAIGTIALFAAFIPAFGAWLLDVERERQTDMMVVSSGDVPSGRQDSLKLSWMPMIGGLLAGLAPILTSPFVEALKSIIQALSRS